jgi:uncharacterized protein YhjY with autotransporter beta-barrel domain
LKLRIATVPAGLLVFLALIGSPAFAQGYWASSAAARGPAGFTVGTFSSATVSEISIVSGDGQTGEVGTQLPEPLVVRVSDQDGQPFAEAGVSWSVSGDADLLDGADDVTDDQGLASNRVVLGNTVGDVVVRAQAEQTSLFVEFHLTAELTIDDVPGLSEGTKATAVTLVKICTSGNEGGMQQTCDALRGFDDEERKQAVEELTPSKVASQGVVSMDASTAQLGNLFKRLAALRKAKQRNLQQLTVDLDVGGVPLDRLAEAASGTSRIRDGTRGPPRGGAASADGSASEDAGIGRLGLFINGVVGSGDRPDSERETGFDFDMSNLTLGLDYRVSDALVLGGALVYISSETDLAGSGGELDGDGVSLAGYGLYFPSETWYLEGVLGFGQSDFESSRVIDFPGMRQVATAEPEGDNVLVALGFGRDSNFGSSTVGLFGRGSLLSGTIDAYQEHGAPGMQLAIGEQDLDSLLGQLGVEYSYAASASWGVFIPKVRLSFNHEFRDDSRLITAAFVDDPQANSFLVPTEDPDRDYMTGGLGASAVFGRGKSAFVWYEQDFARDDLDIYVVSLGLRFELK